MLSKRDRSRNWWYVIPMVALLLGLGIAAYALQVQSGAAPLMGKAAFQPNAATNGSVAAPADTNWDVQVPPKKVAGDVTVGYSVKNDVSPPLREMAVMHRMINQELGKMQHIRTPATQNRAINCATCHRGVAIPR